MIKWPEIQYREAEDGMLYPLIDYPKQPAEEIGKYGRMRKDYLEKHRTVAYQMMILEGTLKQQLMDINEQAHEMLEQLIEEMKQSENVTEQLKSSNQLEWVQKMNETIPIIV
ncbi:MAG: TnpV protein [Candidatus Faecivicinus sp.]